MRVSYLINFSIAKDQFAGGTWSHTVSSRHYFGVLLGQLADKDRSLAGTWLGVHDAGIRKGYFKWFNTSRDGFDTRTGFDLEVATKELLNAFDAESNGSGPLAM